MGKKTDSENENAVNDPLKVFQGLSIILGGMQMILESVSNPPGKLSGSLLEKELFDGEKEQVSEERESEERELEESQKDDDLPPEEETAQAEDSNQSADQTDRADAAEKDNPDADESSDSDENPDSDESQPQDDVQDKPKDPITKDTLTRVVVSKLNQDKSYSDRINKLVNSYGVSHISDLPEDQYESFLSEITRM